MSDPILETVIIHIVFAHSAKLKGGKWGGVFHLCDQRGENRTRELIYERKRKTALGTSVPGEIFELQGSTDGSTIVPGSARSAGRMKLESPIVVQWSALHEAAKARQAEERETKGRKAGDAFKTTLEPIRAAYARSRGADRVALLAQVVRFITQDTADWE